MTQCSTREASTLPTPHGIQARDVPRVLGDTGPGERPRLLVVLGGLHGNEPCGVLALQRVFARLAQDRSALLGRLYGLAGNRQALAVGKRYLDDDLNRMWRPENLEASADLDADAPRELLELRDIARALEVLGSVPLEHARFLDVHSTSGGGSAFTSLDDTLANRELAFALPVPHVLGLEEELAGTLVSHLNERGHSAIGFESGQHEDPGSVERAEAAIWIAMEAAGVLARGERAEVDWAREALSRQHAGAPGVVEVIYRHPVALADAFHMSPGFVNFQYVNEGQVLARDRTGELRAGVAGMILMPLYQGQGDDGYFLVRPVRFVWLKLSAVLRRLRADRFLPWLPGVTRAEGRRNTYVVDLRRARVLALQFFHLLGYRRESRSREALIMRRRDPRHE